MHYKQNQNSFISKSDLLDNFQNLNFLASSMVKGIYDLDILL